MEVEDESMNEVDELMKTAQLLKAVKVDGEFWMVMQACVNSIVKVAEAIKSRGDNVDTINNDG